MEAIDVYEVSVNDACIHVYVCVIKYVNASV